jgi:hypothetical protein
MSGIPNSFEVEGVLCYPKPGEQQGYYFLPLHGDVQRDDRGRPLFNLVALGPAGYLMLTAEWRTDDATVERVRAAVARRDGAADARTVRLEFAPVRVKGCDLLIGDGAGGFRVLAASPTSGMPPFSALFSVALTPEQFARVSAAAAGRAGFLAVRYDAAVRTPVTSTGRLEALSDRLLPWLREYRLGDLTPLRDALEQAIERGLAAVRLDVPDGAPGRLVADLYERVLARAEAVLPAWLDAADDPKLSAFEVTVTLVEEAAVPVGALADLGALPGRGGTESFTGAAPAGRVEAGRAEAARVLRVRLGFSPAGTPLAWVRVRHGDDEVALVAPDFAAAGLPVRGDPGPVSVAVGYTTGARGYRWAIDPPPGPELELSPRDLGLTPVSVDAGPVAAAGARSAEVSLRYRPPHGPDEQREVVTLSAGRWAARWWVVTRDVRVPRHLEYKWSALNADGRRVVHPAARAETTDIVLSPGG